MTVQTEHQPLVSIWKKTTASSSPKFQRLLLRLLQYDVNIEYLKGEGDKQYEHWKIIIPAQCSQLKFQLILPVQVTSEKLQLKQHQAYKCK